MTKTKIINLVSKTFLSEMNVYWKTEKQIIKKLKKFQETKAKTYIEKRVMQKVSCIVWWYLKIKQWLIKNEKIEILLSNLSK
jgi:hypothetical protein